MSIQLTISPSSETISLEDYISFTTDVTSTVFYTFDGTDPDADSDIYITKFGLIEIPTQYTGSGIVTIKAWASNGIDSSSIETKQYTVVNQIHGLRKNVAYTDGVVSQVSNGLPILGTAAQTTLPHLFNASILEAVSDGYSYIDGYSNGFNELGQPSTYSNKEYNAQNYEIKYPTVNSRGLAIPGVLPKDYVLVRTQPPPSQSRVFKELFNPKAYVIYQDSSDQNDLTPPSFNTSVATGYNAFSIKSQSAYANGMDAPSATMQFVKAFFNAKTQEMTYYYYDSKYNKWIISKSKIESYPPLQGLGPVCLGKSKNIFVSLLFPPPRN